MAVTVRIPTPLRKLTNEQDTVEVESDTVGSADSRLANTQPAAVSYTHLALPTILLV